MSTSRRHLRAALTLALALAVPACASMQERTSSTDNRISNLEAQVADLQRSQQDIVARLTQVRDDLQSALDPLRTQQADRGEDMRRTQTEINALEQQLLLMGERVDALIDQVAALQQSRGTGNRPAMPSGGRDAAPQPVSEAEAIFDAAFLDYTNGNWVLAVDGFQEYLRRAPDSAKAPSALYWLGESRSAQGDHAGARDSFLELASRYPEAREVPDARLRAALEALELEQTDVAIEEIRALVTDYPGADAVLVGCMQLERLGEELPEGCRQP